MYGARKAEELNYLYFKQGRHVPAAITVENGMLSESSYEQLQEYMNGIEGSDNAHKFLLLVNCHCAVGPVVDPVILGLSAEEKEAMR